MIRLIWFFAWAIGCLVYTGNTLSAKQQDIKVYQYHLQGEIGPAAWRTTSRAFAEAEKLQATTILIEINTYGGLMNYADSIRTKILNSKLHTIAYINRNAASAGSLIALACDKIYMVKGASMGAASVVDERGDVMPEKYQSYMRGLMRATAEAKGRDAKIAEAFVDPDVDLPQLKAPGKVLTCTTSEAVKAGMADGEVRDAHEIFAKEQLQGVGVRRYQATWVDQLINFLITPAVSGVLILLIIGGIYFEMQSPGIGFALVVALIAALLFFAPLYIQGLAENWEIVLFVIGLVLLLLEVFVIPGFGIAGIMGIICLVSGLAFSMVPNEKFDFKPLEPNQLIWAFLTVLGSMIAALVLSVLFGKSLLQTKAFKRLVLADEQRAGEGYVSSKKMLDLIHKEGITKTMLRPSGKIEIEGKWYDAVALDGYIDRDVRVYVEKNENYNLFVRKKQED